MDHYSGDPLENRFGQLAQRSQLGLDRDIASDWLLEDLEEGALALKELWLRKWLDTKSQ